MQLIYTSTILFLSSKPIVYIVGTLYSLFAFYWLSFHVEKVIVKNKIFFLIVAMINGLIPTLSSMSQEGEPNPAMILISVPLVVTLEFRLFSKDRLRSYLFLSCAIMLYFTVMFNISALIITSYNSPDIPMDALIIRSSIFSLSQLLLSVFLVIFLRIFRKDIHVLNHIIHDQEKSMDMYAYMLINGIFLAISSGFDHSVFFADSPIRSDALLGMTIRNLIIFITSIIIIMIKVHLEYSRESEVELEHVLSTHKSIQKARYKNSIINFSANATKRVIIDGKEFFGEELWKDTDSDYFSMIERFVSFCINPDDAINMLVDTTPAGIDSIIEEHPVVKFRFRFSVNNCLNHLNLPESINNHLSVLNKEWAWAEMICTFVRDSKSNDVLIYNEMWDIDEDVEKNNSLQKAASLDPLTGLFNRASLELSINNYLSDEDILNKGGALFITDLDHFKDINDNLGHPTGDKLLKETAERVKSVFRDGDIIGRLGGDEFCIFMCGEITPQVVEEKAKILNEKNRISFNTVKGNTINTSMSIGVALYPDDGVDYETLYSHADKALYISKTKGRDCYTFYS